MAKPVGSACNLACGYCYYLPAGEVVRACRMSKAVLEAYVRQYIALTPVGEEVCFCWHGGEPLLRERGFYEKALALQARYGEGHVVTNVLQTNGVLLDEEWCAFLKAGQFLVGISVDGPEDCHDRYRRASSGRGSFAEAMRGVELLNRYGVDYNILSVVTDYSAERGAEVYRFLRGLGTPYLQFAPNVERAWDAAGREWRLTKSSVGAEAFGRFYCEVFDEWWAADRGRTYVELFDTTLALLMGEAPPSCVFAERCGNAAVLEATGDVFACDHFVDAREAAEGCGTPLGNILETPLQEMVYSGAMEAFGDRKAALSADCGGCAYRRLCYGECPKHRLARGSDGVAHNYLCAGYKAYFRHTLPYFEEMRGYILAQGLMG